MIGKFAATLALASLAACGGSPDQSEPAAQETEAPPPATETATAATPAASEAPAAVTIPQSIQGRWGLVAADCSPTRGDAKGLLPIPPTRLEFYESVGTLADVQELAPNRLRAGFDFTGEGMEWRRAQQFEASDDGKSLTRQELGDDAAPGPFRYMRCS